LVVYTAWASFGAVTFNDNTPSVGLQQQKYAAIEASRITAMTNDADGPWTACDLKIQDIHTILNRRSLPDDFILLTFKDSDDAAYVEETYSHQEKVKILKLT
jgi:hypothetical protein